MQKSPLFKISTQIFIKIRGGSTPPSKIQGGLRPPNPPYFGAPVCPNKSMSYSHSHISIVTDISHLARTGNIDSSRLIEVVHVHLGSPIGYEPADLTVHPPPPPTKTIEGGFIFFASVSSATKIFFPKKKWIL